MRFPHWDTLFSLVHMLFLFGQLFFSLGPPVFFNMSTYFSTLGHILFHREKCFFHLDNGDFIRIRVSFDCFFFGNHVFFINTPVFSIGTTVFFVKTTVLSIEHVQFCFLNQILLSHWDTFFHKVTCLFS